MASWRKSEDPWDIDPEKQWRNHTADFAAPSEANEEEKDQGIFAEFAGMFKRKPVQEDAEELPRVCPYCGAAMEKGYLYCGRDGAQWTKKRPGALLGILACDSVRVTREGSLGNYYQTSWCCEVCRKLVIDLPEPTGPNYVWDEGTVKVPEEQKEETNDL